MSQTISATTAQMLQSLDHQSLASCLFAACELALRASRSQVPPPPETMTADQLVRQIIADFQARPAAS